LSDKIIEIKKLPSGITAIATETASDALGLEIGSGCIFLTADDIPALQGLLKVADKHFLRKA
jgi:hypothetical protein